MLVLSRRANEEIKIGEDITVQILSVKGNTVRIGFKAPRDVEIVRAELLVNADEEVQLEAKLPGITLCRNTKMSIGNRINEQRQNSIAASRNRREEKGRGVVADISTLPLASLLPSR